MKLLTITGIMISMFSGGLFADANSSIDIIDTIESRDNGYHAIFLQGGVPDESCDLTDRAILANSSAGGQAMLDVALAALINHRSVILRVSGCSVISPDQAHLTAPSLKKVQIMR